MNDESELDAIALLRPLAYEDNNYFVYVCAIMSRVMFMAWNETQTKCAEDNPSTN